MYNLHFINSSRLELNSTWLVRSFINTNKDENGGNYESDSSYNDEDEYIEDEGTITENGSDDDNDV